MLWGSEMKALPRHIPCWLPPSLGGAFIALALGGSLTVSACAPSEEEQTLATVCRNMQNGSLPLAYRAQAAKMVTILAKNHPIFDPQVSTRDCISEARNWVAGNATVANLTGAQ